MNYSEMTDFEINLAAAHIALGVDGYDWSIEKQEVYIAGMDGGEFLPQAHFNPCKSWSDAGPIIASNLIAIKPVALYVGGHRWFATKGEGDFGIKAADNNPLRAAMIVFLMMQEKK